MPIGKHEKPRMENDAFYEVPLTTRPLTLDGEFWDMFGKRVVMRPLLENLDTWHSREPHVAPSLALTEAVLEVVSSDMFVVSVWED
jgi:hypothetical protein